MRTGAWTKCLRAVAALAALPITIATTQARADGPPPPPSSAAQTAPDVPKPSQADDAPPPERTLLFQDQPQVAAPLRVLALSRLTYTGGGSSPTRPFASNVATSGAMWEVGGEIGLLPGLSLLATGVLGESGQAGVTGTGAVAGLRLSLLPSTLRYTHLVLSAGYLHELSGGNGAWARAAFSQDIGRARLSATVHGEHVFATGRDGVDVMVMMGASYRVAGPLRLGAEYVGQDLEETFADQAEAGPRHFLGPTASAVLLGDRLSLVAGPAFGLSSRSPGVLGRVGVAYAF